MGVDKENTSFMKDYQRIDKVNYVVISGHIDYIIALTPLIFSLLQLARAACFFEHSNTEEYKK